MGRRRAILVYRSPDTLNDVREITDGAPGIRVGTFDHEIHLWSYRCNSRSSEMNGVWLL